VRLNEKGFSRFNLPQHRDYPIFEFDHRRRDADGVNNDKATLPLEGDQLSASGKRLSLRTSPSHFLTQRSPAHMALIEDYERCHKTERG